MRILFLIIFCVVTNVLLGQQPRLVLPIGHTNALTSVSFSPDGKKLLTASYDGTAKIWDVQSGALLISLKGQIKCLNSAVYSSDGKKILTISCGGAAETWDAQTGKLLRTFGRDESPGLLDGGDHAGVFSRDNKKILTYGNGPVELWDAQTGNRLSDVNSGMRPKYDVRSADLSPDGKKVVMTMGMGVVVISETILGTVWDVTKDTLICYLENSSIKWRLRSALFSPDGKKILTRSWDNTAQIWDAQTGTLLLVLEDKMSTASFSSDGKKIALACRDSTAKICDAQTGEQLIILKGNKSWVKSVVFSPGAEKVVATLADSTAKVWDLKTGNLLATLKDNGGIVGTPHFSPVYPDDPDGGKRVVTISAHHAATVWDVPKGILVSTYKGHTLEVEKAIFNQDGNKIITYSGDSITRVWNVATAVLESSNRYTTESNPFSFLIFRSNEFMTVAINDSVTELWDVTGYLARFNGPGIINPYVHLSVAFSPDRNRIVTASTAMADTSVRIWDAKTGNLLVKLKENTHSIISAVFSPDGEAILTASTDNTQKKWNAKTGELLYTFFAVDSIDYFNQVPSGYYQCTPTAARLLHYVTKDFKVIGFEQLDIKYNRPDKVLEAIGNTDTALIKSYRKAWEKRIKKLGIDTTAFRDGYSVPEADFVNRDAIEYEQKNEKLTLRIKGTDSIYKLDRFNLWINEVPIFGLKGKRIRNRNSNNLDTTITIKLSQGENRIETSITNINGTESYRMPLMVNYTPDKPQKEMAYFFGIGIDKFSDNQYNLQYSAKDIRDLADSLKNKYKDNIVIDTLFNENVTIANVKVLKQKLQTTTENDKVIIAYSGHGMLSKDYDYYLSTYAVNFEKPEEGGLSYDDLENLLDSIPARKKLMLIDACHSGEVDKDDLVTLNASSDSLIKGLKPVAYKKEGHLGLKNSFELMQSLFVNVGKSTGATIISAAAGTQFALERNDLKNGVFTYSILEAMKNNSTMKISELKKIVGVRVEQLTKGLQKPTSRNETIAVDWNVW